MMRRSRGAACAAAMVVGAALIAPAAGAAPPPACDWPAEAEADRAVRLQIELMLIGETCQDPSYARFLERQGDALAAYQQILLERFEREHGAGAAAAEAALERYLTRLANEAALRAGGGRATAFCAEASDLVATVNGLPPNGLRAYVAAGAAAPQSYGSNELSIAVSVRPIATRSD